MTHIKSRISSISCQDEPETRRTAVFQEVLLDPQQLAIEGIGPAIEVAFSASPDDGDTITLKNGGVTEVYTFLNAPAVPFDIQIFGGFSLTRDAFIDAINNDSVEWGASKTPGIPSSMNIFRLAFDGSNDDDRVFANLTTAGDMRYNPLNDGQYDSDFGVISIVLIAADPLVKEFGFGRIQTEFKLGEIHSFLNDVAGTTKRWNPTFFVWQFTSTPFNSGEYTGDGTTGLAITDVGFKPRYVKIWPKETADSVNVEIVESSDTINDDNGEGMSMARGQIPAATRHASKIDAIVSLDNDGFTVSDGSIDDNPNTNAQDYNWIATG